MANRNNEGNNEDFPGCVVIDNGSEKIRWGIAGPDARPRSVFNTVATGAAAAEPAFGAPIDWLSRGPAARAASHALVERGYVVDAPGMEQMWRWIVTTQLAAGAGAASPTDVRSVTLATRPTATAKERQRACEFFVEDLGVPAVGTADQPLLTLLQSGRTTGAVLELGEGVTHAACYADGVPCARAVGTFVGGADVTRALWRGIADARAPLDPLPATATWADARAVKHAVARAAAQPWAKSRATRDRVAAEPPVVARLLDGTALLVTSARYQCVEPLFVPRGVGSPADGIVDVLHHAIEAVADRAARAAVLGGGVVLGGGSARIDGLAQRVRSDLAARLHTTVSAAPAVTPAPSTGDDATSTAWAGGCILAACPEYHQHGLVTAHDLAERGPECCRSAFVWPH